MTATRPSPVTVPSPADPGRGVGDTVARRRPSLSPSRAGDFMTCPLLYRFRVIDRLPEKPSREAVRGTVVHQVLEDLFDLPAEQRTLDRARVDAARRVGRRARAGRGRGHRAVRDARRRRRRGSPPAVPLLETYFRLEDPHPARAGRARAAGRDHARRRPGAARLRRPARPQRRRRHPGRRLQDRQGAGRGLRAEGAVPDALLRPGPVARHRHASRACCSCSTSAASRSCATSPTRPTCSPPSARSRRSGRRSSAPTRPATGARRRRGCATGATTRRCCPAFGGTPPPLPAPPVDLATPALAPRRPSRRRASPRPRASVTA